MADKYIAGRDLTINGDLVPAGTELTDKQSGDIPYIDSFVRTGYLYRVVSEKGYGALPPHLFNAVNTRKEVKAILAGDPGIDLVSEQQGVVAASEVVQTALVQAEEQEKAAVARKRRGRGPTPEEAAEAIEITAEAPAEEEEAIPEEETVATEEEAPATEEQPAAEEA